MYQRVGAAAYKEGLDGIRTLCERLGNPQEGLRFVHVAGTNGKGSTSHFLASIFQEAGFKTGLYTSPHLVDFRERIKINGQLVSEDFVVDFTAKNKWLFTELQPSFFEMTVAMSFAWFAQNKTDIVILEVGMGGRLDSTNIIQPELSIITNIGMDHMKFLGNSIEKIAAEKAGIIKPSIPVVVGEYTPETKPVFEQKAQESNSPLFFAQDLFQVRQDNNSLKQFILSTQSGEKRTLICPLSGHYQEANIATAYASFEVLKNTFGALQEIHFEAGLKNVLKNTLLRGRWETLQTKPHLICDIGHNEHGFKQIMQSIQKQDFTNLWMVLGFVNDKDLSPVLAQLPKNARYIFTQSSSERSIPAEELAEIARTFELHGETIKPVKKAVAQTLEKAKQTDLVFLGGSTFVVADYLS